MTLFIALLVLVALGAALLSTLQALVAGDGLGHRPLPRSHRDEQARELATWTH